MNKMNKKINELRISGADDVTLITPKGVMAGFSWDGARLVHPSGKSLMFCASVSSEIDAAAKESHSSLYETKMGYEIKDGDREGWKLMDIVGDAHGRYSRAVRAEKTVSVFFARDDLA
jgi:hypothetical protein